MDPNLRSDPLVSARTFVLIASGAFLSVAITAGESKRDPDPGVTRPPGCECVSLSCAVGFLTLCWYWQHLRSKVLSVSSFGGDMWETCPDKATCSPGVRVDDCLGGFACAFSHQRFLKGASLIIFTQLTLAEQPGAEKILKIFILNTKITEKHKKQTKDQCDGFGDT